MKRQKAREILARLKRRIESPAFIKRVHSLDGRRVKTPEVKPREPSYPSTYPYQATEQPW